MMNHFTSWRKIETIESIKVAEEYTSVLFLTLIPAMIVRKSRWMSLCNAFLSQAASAGDQDKLIRHPFSLKTSLKEVASSSSSYPLSNTPTVSRFSQHSFLTCVSWDSFSSCCADNTNPLTCSVNICLNENSSRQKVFMRKTMKLPVRLTALLFDHLPRFLCVWDVMGKRIQLRGWRCLRLLVMQDTVDYPSFGLMVHLPWKG